MNDPREEQKRLAAERAMTYVEENSVLGVGTGTTVAYFIQALGRKRGLIEAAVSSSDQSSERLKEQGIRVVDLNTVGSLSLYVDGADECDPQKCLIKGGGAALTGLGTFLIVNSSSVVQPGSDVQWELPHERLAAPPAVTASYRHSF